MSRRSNREKFLMLMGGCVILSVVSYYLAFSRTLTARAQYVALEEKMQGVQSLSSELDRWQNLNARLDEKLGGEQVLAGFHESLLNSVGRFCDKKNLTLTEFSEPFEGEDGGYTVETIVLTIEGGYKPLLELVYHLETQFRGGRVASVSFVKKKDYRKNREELFVEMYVQKIKMKEDENI